MIGIDIHIQQIYVSNYIVGGYLAYSILRSDNCNIHSLRKDAVVIVAVWNVADRDPALIEREIFLIETFVVQSYCDGFKIGNIDEFAVRDNLSLTLSTSKLLGAFTIETVRLTVFCVRTGIVMEKLASLNFSDD